METTEKRETLRLNAFLLAGVIGFGSAVVLGIVSLPSVSRSLSWQEFRMIQVHPIYFSTSNNKGHNKIAQTFFDINSKIN